MLQLQKNPQELHIDDSFSGKNLQQSLYFCFEGLVDEVIFSFKFYYHRPLVNFMNISLDFQLYKSYVQEEVTMGREQSSLSNIT